MGWYLTGPRLVITLTRVTYAAVLVYGPLQSFRGTCGVVSPVPYSLSSRPGKRNVQEGVIAGESGK